MMILDVNTFNEHHKNKNGSDAYEVKNWEKCLFLAMIAKIVSRRWVKRLQYYRPATNSKGNKYLPYNQEK